MKKPSVSDERFFAIVAEELDKGIIIPGLRAKSFAEANGVENLAQALYLKYRVAQLVMQEIEALRNFSEEQARRKNQERAAEVAAQAVRAKTEGLTLVHLILIGLLSLVVGSIIWKLI